MAQENKTGWLIIAHGGGWTQGFTLANSPFYAGRYSLQRLAFLKDSSLVGALRRASLACAALVFRFFSALRFLGCALRFRSFRPSLNWGFPFWRLDLTRHSSWPAYGGRLTLGVSPAETTIHAGRYLFQRSAFLKGFFLGVLALRWASPAPVAQVPSLFGL